MQRNAENADKNGCDLTQRHGAAEPQPKGKTRRAGRKMEGERFLTQRTQRNAEKRRAAKSWKGTALTQRHSAAK